jgi:hypothetical protein
MPPQSNRIRQQDEPDALWQVFLTVGFLRLCGQTEDEFNMNSSG